MDSKENTIINKRPDDISVRKLLLKIKEYVLFLLRWWWLIAIVSIAWGVWDFYQVSKIQPTFPGEVSLLVKFQDIAKENKNKILTYSRLINSPSSLQDILLQPTDSTNNQLVVDLYLETYSKFNPVALPKEIPSNFKFSTNNPSSFTETEAIVFREIFEKISTPKSGYADGFINLNIDESLGIITTTTATPSEELTFLLLDKINKRFQKEIIVNSSYSETNSYTAFKNETDSLELSYRRTYHALNEARSRHQTVYHRTKDSFNVELVYLNNRILKLEIEADIYKANYLASLNHLKAAQNNMNSKLPIIKILSQTLRPIKPFKPSILLAILKGLIKGAISMVFIVLITKVFLDIIKEGL